MEIRWILIQRLSLQKKSIYNTTHNDDSSIYGRSKFPVVLKSNLKKTERKKKDVIENPFDPEFREEPTEVEDTTYRTQYIDYFKGISQTTRSKGSQKVDSLSLMKKTDQNKRVIQTWEKEPVKKKDDEDNDTVYKSIYQKSYLDHFHLQPETGGSV